MMMKTFEIYNREAIAWIYFESIPFFAAIIWGLLGIATHIMFSFLYSADIVMGSIFFLHKLTMAVAAHLVIVGIIYCFGFLIKMKNSSPVRAWRETRQEEKTRTKEDIKKIITSNEKNSDYVS